jgi:hypothetical protein
MSRKQERQHRGLLFTPYVSPPPKLPSRFTRLLDSDSEEEDGAPIPDLHQDGPSSEVGQNEESDCDEPAQADGSFDDNDNEADQSLDVDDDILVIRNMRWSATLGDRTRPDDEDSDCDIEDDPVEDAGDGDDDRYDDWAAIEAEFGLSAWNKLGEGFEQEIAGIGMPQCSLMNYTNVQLLIHS